MIIIYLHYIISNNELYLLKIHDKNYLMII